MWVATPIVWVSGKAKAGIIYRGLSGELLMNVISSMPVAFISFFAGFTICRTIEKPATKPFVILLCILYTVNRFFAVQYHIAPDLLDYIFLALFSIIPAITCYFGGTLADRIDFKGMIRNT